jgi:hypothetical protein
MILESMFTIGGKIQPSATTVTHACARILYGLHAGHEPRVRRVSEWGGISSKRRSQLSLRLEGWPLPPRLGEKPVTWVSIEEARAYSAWAGKRLPREWELQYAAQSADGRIILFAKLPWG